MICSIEGTHRFSNQGQWFGSTMLLCMTNDLRNAGYATLSNNNILVWNKSRYIESIYANVEYKGWMLQLVNLSLSLMWNEFVDDTSLRVCTAALTYNHAFFPPVFMKSQSLPSLVWQNVCITTFAPKSIRPTMITHPIQGYIALLSKKHISFSIFTKFVILKVYVYISKLESLLCIGFCAQYCQVKNLNQNVETFFCVCGWIAYGRI